MLKIVTVGAGYFSKYHYDGWQRTEGAKVYGNCNRTMASALKIGQEYDIPHQSENLSELIDKIQPDLVDIITPPHTHLHYLKITAAAGVNTIVQKPFGQNLDEAKEMVSLAKSADIDLIVHENFRFMPWFRKIKKIIEIGTLGEIYNVQFNLRPGDGQGPEAYLERQAYFQTMEKLLIHETGVHFIDTFRYLFGRIESVYAALRKCNPIIAGEDSGIIIFNIEGGLQAVFDGNRLLDHRAKNKRVTMGEMLIEGSEGSLRLDGDANLYMRKFGDDEEILQAYSWNNKNFGGDCVYNLIEHVVNHYNFGTVLENRAADYLDNIVVENAIYQSHESKRRMDI